MATCNATTRGVAKSLRHTSTDSPRRACDSPTRTPRPRLLAVALHPADRSLSLADPLQSGIVGRWGKPLIAADRQTVASWRGKTVTARPASANGIWAGTGRFQMTKGGCLQRSRRLAARRNCRHGRSKNRLAESVFPTDRRRTDLARIRRVLRHRCP